MSALATGSSWRKNARWPYRLTHVSAASVSRWSWAPRWSSPVHTSAIERPSSACHSSGGRSSMARTIATWLTGLLVAARIARSASLRPVNNQTSPLRVIDAASSNVMALRRRAAIGVGVRRVHGAYCTTDALAEAVGDRRADRCRRRRRRRRATPPSPHVDRVRARRTPRPSPRPPRRGQRDGR